MLNAPGIDAGLDWFKVEGDDQWCMRFVGALDVLNDVAIRRPVKNLGEGNWDLGELT
jgi:hypothetical protein